MSRQRTARNGSPQVAGDDAHRRLLAGVPVTERRMVLAGVSTVVLEGGNGPPLVLLCGQGGWAGGWPPAIAELVGTFQQQMGARWAPFLATRWTAPAHPSCSRPTVDQRSHQAAVTTN